MIQNREIDLRRLQSTSFDEWLSSMAPERQRLCVMTCGYEERGRYWTERASAKLSQSAQTDWLVAGFKDYDDALSRPMNDAFYEKHGLPVQVCHYREKDEFLALVKNAVARSIKKADDAPVEIHIDYSCMPRKWYCNLPKVLEQTLRPQDRAVFWYSHGDYSETDTLPTAGIGDFSVFAGRASLSATYRTHFLGLGLDRVRSQSIFTVIDPQNLLCIYAEPLEKHDYRQRLQKIHADLLSQTRLECSLPLNDFSYAFSKICAMATEFRSLGDVVLVPDGPKPLIFACSLAPMFLRKSGIVCFHVSRRVDENLEPIDVKAAGPIYGFSFAGPAMTEPRK